MQCFRRKQDRVRGERKKEWKDRKGEREGGAVFA
jgi:hypothetical protein